MMRQLVATLLVALLAFPAFATNLEHMRPGMRGANGGVPTYSPVYITPGATAVGSWAATSQPGNQGSGGDYGYNDAAIAVWDIVPYQAFNTPFQLCVAAYHTPTVSEYGSGKTNNVDHVAFAINGGSFVNVYSQTLNPLDNMLEYCASVRPSDFAGDVYFEARAVVYPTTGIPLVLQGTIEGSTNTYLYPYSVTSMFGYSNNSGTAPSDVTYVATTGADSGNCQTAGSPCLTISYAKEQCNTALGGVGGCVINLSAGSYVLGAATENFTRTASHLWLTVQAKSGVDPATVIITGQGNSSGLRVTKLRLYNLTVNVDNSLNSGIYMGSGNYTAAWIDHVTWNGQGRGVSAQPISYSGEQYMGIYCTDSTIAHMTNGCIHAFLNRNTTTYDIASDAYQNSYAVINTTEYNVNGNYTAFGALVVNTGNFTSGSPIVTNVTDTSQLAVGASICALTCALTTVTGINVDGANTIHLSANATGTATAQTLDSGQHGDVFQGVGGAITVLTHTAGTNTFTVGGYDVNLRIGNALMGTNLPAGTYVTNFDGTTVTMNQNSTGAIASVKAYRSNVFAYGITATNTVQAQGWFADSASPNKDSVLLNSSMSNQTPGMLPANYSSYQIMQYGSPAQNMNIVGSTFTGPMTWRTDLKFTATDVTILNTTCNTSPYSSGIVNHSTTGVTYRGGVSC